MKYKMGEEDLSWGEIPDGLEGLMINRPLDVLAGGAWSELAARLSGIDKQDQQSPAAIKQQKRHAAWQRMSEKARWLHRARPRRFYSAKLMQILRALAPGEPKPCLELMNILQDWGVSSDASTRDEVIQSLLENATVVEDRYRDIYFNMKISVQKWHLTELGEVHLNLVAILERVFGYSREDAQRQRTLALATPTRSDRGQRTYSRRATPTAVASNKLIQLELTSTA